MLGAKMRDSLSQLTVLQLSVRLAKRLDRLDQKLVSYQSKRETAFADAFTKVNQSPLYPKCLNFDVKLASSSDTVMTPATTNPTPSVGTSTAAVASAAPLRPTPVQTPVRAPSGGSQQYLTPSPGAPPPPPTPTTVSVPMQF